MPRSDIRTRSSATSAANVENDELAVEDIIQVVLVKDKTVVQQPSSRRGGGPAWTPVSYTEALKLQQGWLANRWCLSKTRNEFVGDKQLERAGAGARDMVEFREKVRKAYTDLVSNYLAVQVDMVGGAMKVVGAKLAYSKVEAIIGSAEVKKLKEANARITTQVHIYEDSWYHCLTPVRVAEALNPTE